MGPGPCSLSGAPAPHALPTATWSATRLPPPNPPQPVGQVLLISLHRAQGWWQQVWNAAQLGSVIRFSFLSPGGSTPLPDRPNSWPMASLTSEVGGMITSRKSFRVVSCRVVSCSAVPCRAVLCMRARMRACMQSGCQLVIQLKRLGGPFPFSLLPHRPFPLFACGIIRRARAK